MKKILNFIVIFVLFTSNIFAADEIDKGKTLLKSLSKKSLTKNETISFLKEYAIILEDERGNGEVTYVFDDENYSRYKGIEVISTGAWRFSKLGALRLFNGDIKISWKIKITDKENLINIKAKFDPIGKLYEFSYQPKENFLELIQQAPEQQKADDEEKKQEEQKLAEQQKADDEEKKQEEQKLAEQQKADEEKVTEKKELKTYQISNEKELANYLVKNGLTLKKTHRWLFGEWLKLDSIDRKSIVFTFESNDKGNLFHLEDKAKMIIVWNALNKNSFNFKHPDSPYGPKVINLDLKNNLAQDVVVEGVLSNKFEIISISAADIEKAKKEKQKEEQILAQQKAEEETKKVNIKKKETDRDSGLTDFLSNPTLWLIFGIILISILVYQFKLLQKFKEYLLKWNNKNNKLFKTKKKQKSDINYFSKFDWLIKWAKENKKYAIWVSISAILISWIFSPILVLLYLFGAPYLKDIKKDYIDFKKTPEGFGKVKHPFFIKAYGVIFIPIFAFFIIDFVVTPNIKDAERARKYLSNTQWEFKDTWQFDATKWFTSKTRFVFDEDADNCHSEFKPDPDSTKQSVGSNIKWIVFDGDMIDSIEKKTFVNDFGRDTGNVYFKINSDCFQMNKQPIKTVFLTSSGNLYVRYWHISTGDQVEKKLKKK